MTTLHAASVLLGIDDNTAYTLAAREWLPTRRKNTRRYVTRAALCRLVQEPRCWLVVAPLDIPDPELRGLALTAQRATPGRWWSSHDLQAALCLCEQAVGRRRRAGWASGQWERWGAAWWLWADTLPPYEPCAASKAATAERWRRAAELEAAHGRREAAALLGVTPNALRMLARRGRGEEAIR